MIIIIVRVNLKLFTISSFFFIPIIFPFFIPFILMFKYLSFNRNKISVRYPICIQIFISFNNFTYSNLCLKFVFQYSLHIKSNGQFRRISYPRNLPVSLETISRKSLERIKGYNISLTFAKVIDDFFSLSLSPFEITKQGQSISLLWKEISFTRSFALSKRLHN